MNNVIVFKSHSDLDAERNVQEFISFCRGKLTVLGAELKWDSPVWKGIAIFRKLDTGCGTFKDEYLLDKNFVDFAKSYIRYQQALNPVKKPGTAITVLKCLEKALLQVHQNAYVYNTSVIVLDEALQIAGQHYGKNFLYKCGYEIEKLAKFLSEYHFVKCGFLGWVNPVKPHTKNNYLPEKENEDRKNKLPDERALLAIAEIFSRPDEELSERDLFTASAFALLMCSPSRASEILALRADCEITRNDKNGVERYGLRFYSVKGYGATIKWIPDVIVPVARKAISRLRRLSENARTLAGWYESSPDKFYRHSLCPEVSEDKPLDVIQVCHALGYPLNDKKQCIEKLKRTSLDGGTSFLNPKDGHYTLRKLWKMITGLLPADFPWFDEEKSVKYSNALCLLNLHQCHELKMTVDYVLYRPTYDFFTQDIEKARKNRQVMKNIFARYDYLDDSGKALYLRSHQPRHLLNTLAHLGELSELDIAKWSGRVTVMQNRDYNHTSQEEMLEKVGTLKLGNHRYCYQPKPGEILPVGTGVFNDSESGAIHLTPHGYCIHDYVIPPCRKLSETAHYGWVGHSKMSEQQREQSIKKIRSLWQMAKDAVDDDHYGADRWVAHYEEVLSILDKKIPKKIKR
ncbi:TPA: DNA-binding protein [Escherichia coli]|uniref:DNA-binding protein n=2 Tax=Escherichia coli TaxID=562 RepID=UPI00122E7B76|nr:DNA-binding protein [Escherichia coli]EFG7434109.1 DNA-binding protein [Escherichia coli]EFO6486025.1 DNA-binding protein [Escherichia coli]KAA2032280.1 DNA-binding protein [Escherichia coli]MBB0930872.1 DNA-binding protein [Escherichia coli]HAK9432036.1 DNA-binding protein [Escherichia coli]